MSKFKCLILSGIICTLALLLTEQRAYSLGLGIVIGGPTGISLKSQPRGATAIDGAVALSGDRLTLQSQYIKHHSRLVYYGLGARLKLNLEQDKNEYTSYSSLSAKGDDNGDDNDSLGLGDVYGRAPLGIRAFFDQIEVFGEGALLMQFIPSTRFSVDIAIGARVYF